MKDKEIVKGLEEIIKHLDFTQIKSGENVLANALDLINRLQEENEKNENIIRLADKTIETQNAEIERLQLEIEAVNELINPLPFKSNFDKAIETAKVEAYKEFLPLLEKFRDEVVDKFIIMCDGNDYNKLNLMSMVDTIDCIYDKHIENLLKESVGDTDV